MASDGLEKDFAAKAVGEADRSPTLELDWNPIDYNPIHRSGRSPIRVPLGGRLPMPSCR